jgi:hypothetical protein
MYAPRELVPAESVAGTGRLDWPFRARLVFQHCRTITTTTISAVVQGIFARLAQFEIVAKSFGAYSIGPRDVINVGVAGFV